MDQIPIENRPNSQFLKCKTQNAPLLPFPFVAKPDVGERGKFVEIIHSQTDWANYKLENDLLLQDYIDMPIEFGVFYAKLPHESMGKILSITGKEFLSYEADGQSTIKDYVLKNPRSSHRIKYLQTKFSKIWEVVFPKGTKLLLEPIGNHNRGTRFYDASNLKTTALLAEIDKIANCIEGFNYGRFDVKTQSIDAFQKGQIKVIEINGANSEPTHIYDNKFTMVQAYLELKRHFDIQYKIAISQPTSFSSRSFYKAIIKRILNRNL